MKLILSALCAVAALITTVIAFKPVTVATGEKWPENGLRCHPCAADKHVDWPQRHLLHPIEPLEGA